MYRRRRTLCQGQALFGLGYKSEAWQRLRDDLLRLASSGEAAPGPLGPYGQKMTVSGSLIGPNGRTAEVISG